MIEWSDTDLMVRDTVRQFIDKEIRPHLDELESGELSPYPIARKLFSQFGLDVLAAESVKKMLDSERAKQEGKQPEADEKPDERRWFRRRRRRARGRWSRCWSPRSPGSASDCSARRPSAWAWVRRPS